MKILLVHNFYRQHGGEDSVVIAEKNLLERNGHTVVTLFRDNTDIDGYTIGQKALFPMRTVFNRSTVRQICELVDREQPAIAHVHNVFPLLSPSTYRALHGAGLKIVQTVHNFRLLCPNGQFWIRGEVCEKCKFCNSSHAVLRRCYRDSYALSAIYAVSIAVHRMARTFELVDRFIALTRFSAQKLVESRLCSQEKITVLGNAIPGPLPDMRTSSDGERMVLFLGRVSAEKGIMTLLEAVAGLPGVQLKIAGDGPEKDYLQGLVKHRGMGNVEFLGFCAGQSKSQLLRRAAAVVVPSVWYEHFPVVILEAMAAGTPVLASSIGSLPEIVEDGRTGWLFEPGNPLDLRDKLNRIWEDPAGTARLARSARRLVEAGFSPDAHYGGLMKIYEGEMK